MSPLMLNQCFMQWCKGTIYADNKVTHYSIDTKKKGKSTNNQEKLFFFQKTIRGSEFWLGSQMRNYSAQYVHCRSSGERVIISSTNNIDVKRGFFFIKKTNLTKYEELVMAE
ncbi:hypothetical protein BDA96_10G335000 [Sorghum bicolor]|uniref:Uncharacterized protein n=2 Tax=Sorghum bicolor TaxID=4558 RepID=A0A921U2Z0_SORBI|nr:hypothetical protein BDA96_10G335000 [Sorghum bicolor]KXG20836.1 hypothetical protein SORBI_3010G259800 [Sorghum bicolor]